jgi:hypothetical protein
LDRQSANVPLADESRAAVPRREGNDNPAVYRAERVYARKLVLVAANRRGTQHAVRERDGRGGGHVRATDDPQGGEAAEAAHAVTARVTTIPAVVVAAALARDEWE